MNDANQPRLPSVGKQRATQLATIQSKWMMVKQKPPTTVRYPFSILFNHISTTTKI